MSLINCKLELDLSKPRKCIISEIYESPEVPANPASNPPMDGVAPTLTFNETFKINSTKVCFPVVNLYINDNNKFLEDLKLGFKGTPSWNKYRSEITTQPKNSNLDNLIDTTFTIVNSLFVLSFKNCVSDPTRLSFDRYYMPLVEIKDFNALIDNKPILIKP